MTFAQIYADVLNRLHKTGVDATAKTKTWINQSYLDICSRADWAFLQDSTTLNETINVNNIDISAFDQLATAGGSKRIYGVYRTDPTTSAITKLQFVEPAYYFETLLKNTPTQTASDPIYYTVWDRKLYLDPKPDQSGTASITVWYYKLPALLSGDSDNPIIPVQYHNLLVLGAYAVGIEGTESAQTVQMKKSEYENGIRRMIQELLETQLIDNPSFGFPYKTYEV